MRQTIKRFLFLVIACYVAPVYAQEWTVWLYQTQDNLLLHLSNTGDVLDTRIIPVDEGYANPHTLVFSPDLSLMVTVAQGEASFKQRLTLYTAGTDDVRYIYDLPPLNNASFNADDQIFISERGFTSDSTQFAFVSFIGGLGWTIHVLDTVSGEIINTLPYNHSQVIKQPYLHSASIPQIQMFEDDSIGFLIRNEDNNPSPQGHSYAWFLIADQLRETIAFPNRYNDHLAETGETIIPLPDRQFPSDNPHLPRSRLQHNVVKVHFAGEQIRYATISRPALDLLDAWFIQGGERILIEAWEDEIRTRWLIYDRNGNEVRNLPSAGYDLTASPDGFLYLTELNDKTILVHVNTRQFETAGDTVWVDDGEWQIAGVTFTVGDDLLPFAQLEAEETPPPYVTLDNALPTPLPTPPRLVQIGREMQIQVLEDGYINLRDEPSTDGEVQALLENGLYVDIIEGPVESGIYTWWKVRLSGREGWLVEEVNGVQVLISRKPVEEDDKENENQQDTPLEDE